MKVNYSNLLTKLSGMVGVTGISLLIGLPVGANEVLNPSPSIFQEAPYNRSQGILANPNYTLDKSVQQTKGNALNSKKTIAQTNSGSGVLNPSPSIFNEPPYNRRRSVPSPETPVVPTTPETTPSQPGTQTTPPPPPEAGTGDKTLIALAESNRQFTVLTKALKAAGLVDILQGQGPFTVFAPTDAAFAKLPQDAVQELLRPENKEVLVKILTYHVVPGQVLSNDLKSGEVKSVEGGPISVKVNSPQDVMVNDAKVIQPDIKGSNGVIHAIDNVILPPDL
ncbi:beta-Ig-H3/fasciclin [Fischerella thermalis CCMEE 5268]|uniref:Beta-Ig-H3/fasciclin n=1 Tax=Fischerella thermalis CCMEE 5268 TaxID=2019662 RepID=A0A2N6KKI4_9CYAN|nr:fasciclin domain-containing protein [Fischerella thermalis]PMB00250.1 beta-Ig-H3/fasciclin [Fischerella thermalis CCMEE 5268]